MKSSKTDYHSGTTIRNREYYSNAITAIEITKKNYLQFVSIHSGLRCWHRSQFNGITGKTNRTQWNCDRNYANENWLQEILCFVLFFEKYLYVFAYGCPGRVSGRMQHCTVSTGTVCACSNNLEQLINSGRLDIMLTDQFIFFCFNFYCFRFFL